MASTGGGKMRPKRSHGANKPYQRTRPKSFLDRVKDLVTPSWLSNMWASSSHEESPNQQQHSIKQSTSSTNFIYFNPIEVDLVQEPAQRPFGTGVQRVTEQGDEEAVTTPVLKPFAGLSVPVSTSTPVEDVDDDVIDVDAGEGPSTQKDDMSSVVSSLYPNLDKLEHQQKLSDSNLDNLSDLGHRSTPRPSTGLWSHTPSGRHATTRARPASPFSRPQQPAISTRKPSFNTSYFGTPRGSVQTKMDSSTSSPFYPGRTTFGGSSSLRSTSKRPRTSPYEVHLPIKRSVRPRLAKPADESNVGITSTSNTAKRILDTLEKMSTPLSDAKRIPLSPSSTPLAFTASRTPRPRPSSSPQRSVGLSYSSVRIPGPPVSGYNTLRTISITPNRQPPLATSTELPKKEAPSTSKLSKKETVVSNTQSSVHASTPAFTGFSFKPNTQASSSTTQPSIFGADKTPVQNSPPQRASSGGKMKMPKRSSMHYSANKDDDDVIEVPDLPNIPLPLGNTKSLPSFNFGKPLLPSKKTSSSSTSAASASVPSQGFNIVTSTPAVSVPAAEKNEEHEFTFASPILRQSSSTISAPKIETTEAFTFSLPKKADAFPSAPSKPLNFTKSSSSSLPPQTSSFMAKSSVKSPPRDTQGDEEEERGGFGIKPAKTLKTGSCLEVFGLVPSSESTSMETTTEIATSSNDTITVFAEKFKPPPGSWECDTCLILNKAEDNKCIACQTAKPQVVNSHAIPTSSSNVDVNAMNDLRARFKPPEGSWECPTCMIQNKQDVNKCVACMTPNPDSSTKETPVTTTSLMDKFKPFAGSWECDTCLVQNKADAVKCVACTSAKPGMAGSNNPTSSSNTTLTNSNSGSWQCSSCPEKNNADVLKCKGCGVLKATSNSSISTDSLMDKFRPPPGSWTCDVCLINNKESTDRCIACKTPKPGSQPSLKTPPASVFKLGSQSSSSTSSTTRDFKFGGATSSVNFGVGMSKGFNIPAGGVTFGSKKSDTGLTFGSQKDGPASGFQFGSNSEGKTNSLPAADTVQFGSVKTSKTDSGFTFGAPKQSGASSVKEDKPAVSASFQFGAATTTTKADTTPPNVDPFKTAEPSKIAFGTGEPIVNATHALTQETDSKAQQKVDFSFGANKAETSTINYGSAVAEQKQSSAPSTTFMFGTKAPSDNNPPKSQSTFNFSASSNPPSSESQQSADKAVFKFGATPSDTKDEPKASSSSAGFSFGNTPNAIKTTQTAPHQNNMPPVYQFRQSNAGTDEAGSGGPLAKGGVTFGSSIKQTSAPESKAAFSLFGGTPGQTAPQQASTTFVFGGSDKAVETQSKPNGGITFGTPSQSVTSSQPSDQFTFGAATNSNKTGGFNFSASVNQTAAPATGGFQFGAAAAASTTKPAQDNAPPAYGGAFGSSNPTSSSVFGAFGAPATTKSTPNPFGGQQPSQAVAPTFGTPSSSSVFGSVAATPAFGTVASANNSRSSTPTFGATSGNAAPGFAGSGTTVPAFGAGATNSGIGFQTEAAPSFNFGGSSTSSTVFAFGGANNNTAQSTAASQSTGGFNFGAQQQQQQPSGFGMQGGAQNATGAAGSVPGFLAFGGNQAPTQPATFSFGQGGSQRKIRKAVRRTRKT